MNLNVIIGGKAGQGIDKTASIIGKTLVKTGYKVFIYRDYGSLIRGDHNYDVIAISDEEVASHRKEVQGIVDMDGSTSEKHGERLEDDGFTIERNRFKELEKDYNKSKNMIYTGSLAKKMDIDLEKLKETIKEEFKGKKRKIIEENLEAAEKGYGKTENGEIHLKKIEKEEQNDLELITGSEGSAEGAIKAGLDLYLAYPMTPATPILHILSQKQKEENLMAFQAENELSVVNAALGASHTGAKTMIGSSGGGYDLMQESMSMQGVSEIPLTVYLAQRKGEGSGVPTYTEQGDLEIAVKGSHGNIPRIVIAPGDPEEAMKASEQALYFSENYRCLSVILTDKHLAESKYTVNEKPEIKELERNIDTEEKGELYNHYEVTRNGNSPRTVPGINTVKSTSYEHDEKGITTENKEKVKEMVEKRLRKEERIKERSKEFTRYKVHGEKDSENIVISCGSTKGAIKDALKDLENTKFVQLIYLRPFPKEIKKELDEAKNVILVENNSKASLGNLIVEKTGRVIEKDNQILKYDGRPFRSDELRKKIKERLK